MAGSWNHALTRDGKLSNARNLSDMLDNGGDVWEFAQEAYGMVWYLANLVALNNGDDEDPDQFVQEARRGWRMGIEISPGIEDD
jgi:hypothetical protein